MDNIFILINDPKVLMETMIPINQIMLGLPVFSNVYRKWNSCIYVTQPLDLFEILVEMIAVLPFAKEGNKDILKEYA